MRLKKRFIVSDCLNCPACREYLQEGKNIIYKCSRNQKTVPSEGILKDCFFIKVFYKKEYETIKNKVSDKEKKDRYYGRGNYTNPGCKLILSRMKEKGITAPEIAEHLGIKKACFYRYIKTSYHDITDIDNRIKKLCEILEIDINNAFPYLSAACEKRGKVLINLKKNIE